MGLMDQVKAQASQLAQKTQEAAAQGKARLDQAQAYRRGEMMLQKLGTMVYAERTGRVGPDIEPKIDKLISDISAHEKENGLNLTGGQPDGGVPPQSSAPDASGPF